MRGETHYREFIEIRGTKTREYLITKPRAEHKVIGISLDPSDRKVMVQEPVNDPTQLTQNQILYLSKLFHKKYHVIPLIPGYDKIGSKLRRMGFIQNKKHGLENTRLTRYGRRFVKSCLLFGG